MKWSTQSLQPWMWSLTRAPDSVLSCLRLPGLWFVVVVPWPDIALVLPQSLFFCVACDTTKPRGERTRLSRRGRVYPVAEPAPASGTLIAGAHVVDLVVQILVKTHVCLGLKRLVV